MERRIINGDKDVAARRYNRAMLVSLRLLAVLLLLSLPLAAQEAAPAPEPPAAPAPQHRFWDRTNILLFSGVAVSRALDYTSTRHFQVRGHNEVLIPDDVVNNSAGFAGLEAAGAATSVGISYIFHRTGHHKIERWMSIGHIGVTGFGVVWNYSLAKHP
jgi:hypothetical protein